MTFRVRTNHFRPAGRGLIGLLVLAGSLLSVTSGAAQDPVAPDSIPVADTVSVEAIAADTTTIPSGPLRSPSGAFFRSLILPGWGQAWVGAPGRGSIYFALEAGSLWALYKSYQKLQEAEDAQAWLRQIGELAPTEESGLVETRGQQVEDWFALSLFLAFFSGADAFVSAYLADFDEHIGIEPDIDGALRIRATIPVGGRP